MNAATPAIGSVTSGVLSDQAIYDLVHSTELGELIVRATFDSAALAPASYEPRTARDGLITPGGISFPPGSTGPAKIVLRSGDSAMFSTEELFRMPHNIAGNITVKNQLATEGLMLLSGLLIDPRYGSDETADHEYGCRLYLHVANIGRDQIVINPGKQPIARIQFLRVCGGRYGSKEKIKASKWDDQEKASLGFFSELRDMKDQIARTSDLVRYLFVGGIFVLATTVLGVSLGTILSITSNASFSRSVRTAVPHTSSGKLLLAALALSFALIVFAACVPLWRRKSRRAWRSRLWRYS
jgi:deoxycytidine triphosphate deaminase